MDAFSRLERPAKNNAEWSGGGERYKKEKNGRRAPRKREHLIRYALFSWKYYIGHRERASEMGLVRVSRRCSFCQWFGFPAAGWSFSRTARERAAMGIRRPSDEMCNTTSVCAGNNFISPVSLDGNLILDLCTPTWVLQLSRDRALSRRL